MRWGKIPEDWFKTGVIIFILWAGVPLAILALHSFNADKAGPVGDVFGSINALFAGLAFAGIIITINLQKTELQQNTKELRNQATALEQQVKLMHLSAKISALPVLIQQERERVHLYGGEDYESVSKNSFSIDGLGKVLADIDERIEKERGYVKLWKDRAEEESSNTNRENLLMTMRKHKNEVIRLEATQKHLKRLIELNTDIENSYREISQFKSAAMIPPHPEIY